MPGKYSDRTMVGQRSRLSRENEMNIFLKWQNDKNSTGKHLLFLVIGAIIFPILIPTVLVIILPQVDKMIGLCSFYSGTINIVVGIGMMILGGLIAFSTIFAQIKFASGTPFPMVPTKKLLVFGPYKLCRNPMTLGTFMLYSGMAVMVGCYSALLFVVLFLLALLAYLKLVEEKELELRFGQEYLDYKKDTPFIIPIRIVKGKKADQ
jgi:protein-S-isoprenylcysteine O-methyltransferase Ste14